MQDEVFRRHYTEAGNLMCMHTAAIALQHRYSDQIIINRTKYNIIMRAKVWVIIT